MESITGFSFPRAAGLCTRYATQITCSRENESSVTISIIPRPDADEELKERLLKFGRRGTDLDNDALAAIFKEVRYRAPAEWKAADAPQGKRSNGNTHEYRRQPAPAFRFFAGHPQD